MKDIKIKENAAKIKEYIKNLPKNSRKLLYVAAGAVILVAIILTLVLNVKGGKYVPLYSDLSTTESASIYQALLEMGADAKIASDGTILVSKNEYDIWILQLAAKGYPQTALPYDIFSNHSGMTSTESEKAQWLLYQLQDRIQATLERMDCVQSATVTINVPETSDYVWDKATNKEKASAGVLLKLKKDVVITGEQVSAIQNLVAASVPRMAPEDVKVVNSATMLELTPSIGSETSNENNLDFEMMVQKQIEENVVRLLTPRYGANGVVAVAKATIDYDKMMTEKYEITPGENGEGYLIDGKGSYTVNGNLPAGQIVGEENNTDIPTYGYISPDDENGMTSYNWNNKYDYGYIKTQIESGNAILSRATVSVMVNEEALTAARREELVNLVSGCTDIPTDLIYVSAFNLPDSEIQKDDNVDKVPDFLNLPTWVYIASGVGLLILIILVLIIVTIIKRRKKAKLRALAEAEERARIEEQKRQQEEIDSYKKNLENMAKGGIDPKDEAIMEEVRSFARENPQVTANLLRSWMKEE